MCYGLDVRTWQRDTAPRHELLDNAVTIPGEATERLCQATRLSETHVPIGLNERNAEASNASLYNTILFIDDQGLIMDKHGKLVPRVAIAWPGHRRIAVRSTPLTRHSAN